MQERRQPLADEVVGVIVGAERRIEEIMKRRAAIGDQREIAARLAALHPQSGQKAECSLFAGDKGAGCVRMPGSNVLRDLLPAVRRGRRKMDECIGDAEIARGECLRPTLYELQAVGELA